MDNTSFNNNFYLYFQQKNYLEVIQMCEKQIAIQSTELDYYWALGLAHYLQGETEIAQKIWLSVLSDLSQEKSEEIKKELINFLTDICIQSLINESIKLARQVFDCIYELQEEYQNSELDKAINQVLGSLYQSAIELSKNQQYNQSEIKFKKILDFVDDSLTWYNLSVSYYESKKINLAQKAINRAINLDDTNATFYYTLGLILEKEYDNLEAILAYKKAIDLDEYLADAYNNLGNIYRQIGKEAEAITILNQALDHCPKHPGAYINLGNIYLKTKSYPQAQEVYQKAIENNILLPEIYDGFSQVLNVLGEVLEAVNLLEKVSKLSPNDLFLFRRNKLFLPAIYSTKEEIQFYRKRFTRGLEELSQKINLDTLEGFKQAYEVINGKSKTDKTNFYLGYQGYNDLDLQKKYGQLVHQIMAASYPQWIQPRTQKLLESQKKIKIGYVSGRMESLLARLLIGWIEHRDTSKFAIYSYYIGEFIEKDSQYIKALSDKYYHFPNQLEETCQQILSDSLDILVYFEIGLDPLITQLANLRLAPVQCATWGNPMTTGFPTIDYFLASDAMEPDNAQAHYTEELIRLPKMGFNVAWPNYSNPINQRDFFELKNDDTVYLSCQTISKYLPQHDYLYVEIYRQVPNAKLVFIKRKGEEYIVEKFKQRLEPIFRDYNLDFSDACYFLPSSNQRDYFDLLLLSDIFLDTIGWSGGFTSLDAIACGLPIVTLPTELMRGRQSYGMLKIMGMTETIAQDEAEYIEIAVKLGLNPTWRRQISDQIKHHKHKLFNDHECIAGLEEFYQSVVLKSF
jgi:predicted O-linked N-acetylglucosamine transferase (SPINDLY family)